MGVCVGGGGEGGAAGIPWGLDQQKFTFPGNLTEHFDAGTGPLIEILAAIMCKV